MTESLEKYKEEVKLIRDGVRKNKKGKLFTRDVQSWKQFIEMWQRSGRTDEEINQQLADNLSYELSMDEQWREQRKKSKRQKPIKTKTKIQHTIVKKDEALTISERSSTTISERGVNYLFGQMNIKGIERYGTRGRELDYKLMWAVDFISNEISKQLGFSKDKKGELILFKNANMFFDFIKGTKDGRVPNDCTYIELDFLASDVRKWLGFNSNKMSIQNVIDLFKGLQEVIFEAEGERILLDVEKKEWVKTTVSDTLYSLKREKLDRVVSNRWRTKDVLLSLRFANIMSWLFIGNLSCGAKGRITLPKQARHELTGYQQNILRELRLWPRPKPYNTIELAKIAGLKTKNISELRKSLTKALEGLKKKHYIKDFKLTDIGKQAKFRIFK